MLRLTDIIPEALRARTAFELLASSSLSRYVRVCRSAARSVNVQHAVAVRDVSTLELLEMAEETWRFLAQQTLRDEKEVDLAVLLAILANSADPSVDRFFSDVGMRD